MTELVIIVLTMAGCVYAASSGAKLTSRRNYLTFTDGLRETALVPGRLLRATAAVMAWAEAAVAASLAGSVILTGAGLPRSVPVAAVALACATVLTGLLTAGVSVVIRAGTRATCACFGARAGRELGGSHLARNAGLFTLLVVALIGNEFRHDRLAVGATVVAVLTGAVAAMLVIRLDDLVALFAPVRREATRREAIR
jgi:hypothetical protein